MITGQQDVELRSRGSLLLLAAALALICGALGPSAAAQPADPHFIVEVYEAHVHIYGWAGPATITVSIDDPDTGPGVDYTKSEMGPADTGFNISFRDEYDVEPGHVVEVTDGTTTLTHTVRRLAITLLDPSNDLVAGTADPGSDVFVNVGGPEPIPVPFGASVTADVSGGWMADFASMSYDLLDGAWTSALQADSNGNSTSFTLNPTFTVQVDEDWIGTWGWLAGSSLTLTIDDPATPADPDVVRDLPAAFFASWIDLSSEFDIQPGHVVALTDGFSHVTHTVRVLAIDHANAHTGWVAGTADPGGEVHLESWQNEFSPVDVSADAVGTWAAGPLPLDVTDGVRAQVRDVVWNSTQADRHVSIPHVVMFYGAWGYPELEMWTTNVNGFMWRPGSAVTLEIDDPATPELEYTAVTSVDQNEEAYFELFGTFGGSFVVEPGWLVTLFDDQDPQTVKSHEVDLLTVETVDRATDLLVGTAESGAELSVRVHDPFLPFPQGDDRAVAASQTGQWSASFAGTTDIDFGSNGWVIGPLDNDGDKTQVNWYVIPPPDFIEVGIDIKPGGYPNSLNIDGHGVIPVAVLGSESFDVTEIDTGTLDFAGLGVKANKKGRVRCSLGDVSGDFTTPEGTPDGYLDLTCQFADDHERWSSDYGTAPLTGSLLPEFGATPFFGSDEYRLVPAGRLPAPLVVWTYPEYETGLTEATELFTMDTGLGVIIEGVDISDMENLLSQAGENGEGPDAFIAPHDWTGRLVESGLVEPIDLTSVASEFEPVATQAFLYEGAYWGLPIAVEATALFYNTNLVAAPPTTFEALGPSCDTMAGIENCVGLMRPDAYFHYPFLTAFGGYVFGFDPALGHDPSDVGLDSPGAIAGAQYLEAQVQAGAIGPTGDYDLIRDLFLSGVQPYWITGPWELDALMASGLDWDAVPIPTMDGNEPGPFVGVHGFFRGAYGEREADATFLLDYVATTESMIALFNAGAHRPPAHLEAYAAVADEFTEVIMHSVAVGEPMPNIPEMHYAWYPMFDAFDAIRLGTLPADEAMIQAAQAVRDAIGS